jgi:GNAT superfamily N-acetyltransferase
MRLRVASEADVPVLSGLIERSVRELQRGDYTPLQIEVEHGEHIVGCGGWSKRKTLYGGDIWSGREDELLDPRVDAAKIRAFFVRPDFARRGIGTQLLNECEDAAQKAGFRKFEMGATITGIPLYCRCPVARN